MTRPLRLLALLALAVVCAGACRNVLPGGSSASTLRPLDMYAASPAEAEVPSLLGAGSWWTSGPTFAAPPLNAASMDPAIQYQLIRRYANVGTAESWKVTYTQFDSSSSSSTLMTNLESSLGSGNSGPSVGDKVLYYGQQVTSKSDSTHTGAPFETITFVKVGSVVIESIWFRKDGFPTLSKLGAVAKQLVSRLKDAMAGKIKGALLTQEDAMSLPPPNSAITLLGYVKLPVEAVALMLNANAPTEVAKLFTDLNVKDFIYGDYALDQDTHMEVQAAVFNFSSASDANSVFAVFRGTDTPDANGLITSYNDLTGPGQYVISFVSGTRLALLICRSTAEDANEAASRACERPAVSVSAAWASTLKS